MTEYLFHWLPAGTERVLVPDVRVTADSRLHGAALALRHFKEMGCDFSTPLAHIDITGADGTTHTLLVDEVLDWLSDQKQAEFVRSHRLDFLFSGRTDTTQRSSSIT